MPAVKRFEDLEVWKGARELVVLVYRATDMHKFHKDRSLTDQIKRASVSIMANIAEGFDRGTRKEFIHFLEYSLGSASEVKSDLYIAKDLEYIGEPDFKDLMERIIRITRQMNALVKYLRSTSKSRKSAKN